GDPVLELEGPGADGRGVEGRGVDIDAAQYMLRNDAGLLPGHDIGREALLELDAHSVVIDRLIALDMFVAIAAAHHHLGIAADIEREDDVGGTERFAVMPLDAGTELDRPGEAVRGNAAILRRRDISGEIGQELAFRIELPQRIEDDEFDRGLDAGIDIEKRIE